MATAKSEWPQQNGRAISGKQLSAGPLAFAKFCVTLFTDFEQRRDPPAPNKSQHARLITIRGSHYCEKGRWVMDLLEADPSSPIYYTEDPHPPGFHAFASVAASNDKGSITPCVILDSSPNGEETEFIAESSTLLRRFQPQLYPPAIKDSIIAFEDLIHEKLGPSLRLFMYHTMLEPKHQNAVIRLMTQDTTRIETMLFHMMFGVGIAPAMRKSMRINAENAKIAETAIKEVFAMVSDRLSHGGEYLMDTADTSFGFTGADLTFAALASPLTCPPERKEFNMPDEEISPELLALKKELADTPAFRYVNTIYNQHRLANSDHGVIRIRGVNRNAYPPVFR